MLVLLYSLTILVSAALLFLVQPMFARYLLPLLGGSPQVWNTALVFYQGVLLLGYAYAHFSTKKLGVRKQAMLHAVVVFLPLLALPITLRDANPPTASNPSLWVLYAMAISVGLPYFVVSATSPLLQRWFSMSGDKRAGDPYFLYAASNVGSMVGLLAYPFYVEPTFRLQEQAMGWSIGYGALALMMVACAAVLWARKPEQPTSAGPEQVEAPAVSWNQRWLWLGLAFVPTCLLMGVTTFLTTDVAAVPLLWVIPLALYLLTFVIAFANKVVIPPLAWYWMVPTAVMAALVIQVGMVRSPIGWVVSIVSLAFFIGCMACHSRLAESRPHASRLTEFYLLISLGGVLGGAFCALLAPVLFDGPWEFPLALLLCLGLLPGFLPRSDNAEKNRRARSLDVIWMALMALVTLGAFMLNDALEATDWSQPNWVALSIPAILCVALSLRPHRAALAGLAMAVIGFWQAGVGTGLIWQDRGFFGSLRVMDSVTAQRSFFHGTTKHGSQIIADSPNVTGELAESLKEWASWPLTYYTQGGPAGDLFLRRARPAGARIASVGLGVGSLLYYAKPGEKWSVYEIDPLVVKIAEDPRYFTYLRDAQAPYEIILGDARLMLDRSQNTYDIIVLDAYSSDAVPVHLLTVEAVKTYKDRLAPGGVLAFHISNRHLDLETVVAAVAFANDMICLERLDLSLNTDEENFGKAASQWVLVAREPEDFGALLDNPDWHPISRVSDVKAWTDDYSSIVPVLTEVRKWNRERAKSK